MGIPSPVVTEMTLVKVNGSQNRSVSHECEEVSGRDEGGLIGKRGRMWRWRVIRVDYIEA